jgi:hypothetical protein
MSDSFEFTLHDPLTKEDWDKILDAEHENTKSVMFQTPQGRQVRYIKCEVLDKIRAEIERLHYHPKLDFIKNDEVVEMALEIIDKYTADGESEGE